MGTWGTIKTTKVGMDKDYTFILQVIFITDNMLIMLDTVKDNTFTILVHLIMEIGIKIVNMVMVFINTRKVMFILVNLMKELNKEREIMFGLTETVILVNGFLI